MVYPKISEFCKRITSFLLLVNIVLSVTWTQGEASLTSESSKINEDSKSLTGNINKLSSSSVSSLSSSSAEHQLPKRSVSIPEEPYTRWNIINPSSSSSSSSDNSPSSLPFSSSLNDEYESELDSSDPSFSLSPSDPEFVKRDGARYAFGLGKRGASGDTRYSFGLGKRFTDFSRFMENKKRLPSRSPYGLGKKSRYSFGLGKRNLYEYIKRRYNFGIGKRASQRYAFGLGK
ncbi:allatostatin-A-like [Panonychus citri]|uniref:allatostatin-A-like n=1 Tax=Panonychus citri TaxID=50023 RepID=UPI00230822D2|nr:allatostatin-A-like [Panonychus citri]